MAGEASGERVLALWAGGDFWFPGTVHGRPDGQVDVVYDDGMRETLSEAAVRPLDWAAGTRVEGRWQGGEHWYPARIGRIDGIRVRIDYDDGDVEETTTVRCPSR